MGKRRVNCDRCGGDGEDPDGGSGDPDSNVGNCKKCGGTGWVWEND